MQQVTYLLIPVLILWAWIVPIGIGSRRTEGTIIHVRSLSLLARMKRHAVPNTVIASVTIALGAMDLASPWWLLAALGSMLGLLAIPQSYIITTRGIRAGRGAFRRWTEFAGVYRSPAGATLQTIGRLPDLPIWLSGDLGDDEFVHLLRTLVRDSYKGKPMPLPVAPAQEQPAATSLELQGMAAFRNQPPQR
jgi:hypothetical protein